MPGKKLLDIVDLGMSSPYYWLSPCLPYREDHKIKALKVTPQTIDERYGELEYLAGKSDIDSGLV